MRKILFIAAFVLMIPFHGWAGEDIHIVKEGWKLGLQNANGSVIAPCEYEEIIPIEGSSTHYVISLGGKYGVIDVYGTMLLPVKYSYIIPKLYGNKLLIQQGGSKIAESIASLSIPDNDPYYLHIGSGDNEKTVRYMEINPLEWTPYDRRFTTDGQWGLADIRPNVSMIFPSYSMVSVCPDNNRYILMGYTFGGISAFNIYDTQTENFMLSLDKKVEYSSIYLLRGGYFMVNGTLRRLSEPETDISATSFSYITDLNDGYLLCKSGKNVVLVDKASGKAATEDKNITHYVKNDKTGDFFLKEGGSWVLHSEGQRSGGFKGKIDFMGGYPIDITGDDATVVIDGTPQYKAKTNVFAVAEDGKSIIYINDDSNLVMLEYPSKTEKLLQESCTGFQFYYANYNYIIVRKNVESGEKAGLYDLKTGNIIVPFEHNDIRTLYGDYYVSIGEKSNLRRIDDPEFELPISNLCYNDYTHKPLCWISSTGESDSYALYSMEKDSLLTDYSYSGVELAKYPGRMMMLGNDFVPFIHEAKYGIMDTDGNIVFPAEYSKLIFSFTEGFCTVGNDKKFGCINPYTGVVLPCIYEDIGRFIYGKCIVKKDGLWGIADSNAEIIVPYKYKSIEDFFDDLDWLRKEHFPKKLAFGVVDDTASPATVEWFDNDGKVICTGTAGVPLVKSVIPEGLWDY